MKNKHLLPLSILMLLHLFMCQNLSAQTPCRQQDSLELVNLYNTTNGANWTNKWQLNKPIDTWYGVTLDPQGCVSKIVLRSNNLTGAIPNFNMPNLTTLEISGNYLGGTIPNFNLPNLTTLDMAFNPLSGTIPDFNMPKLETLWLYYTQVSGTIPNFNMPKLKNLILINNKLSGTIPNFNMPELEILSLSQNQLSGTIPNFNLLNLTILNLYKNQLLGSIPNFNLPNLTNLELSANGLSGSIPNFNMPKLENLWLSNNQLSGSIPNFKMPKLKELLLFNNQLSDTIPNFSLPNLTTLNLAYNKLSGTMPSFNMPKLRKLLLYVNQLSGTIPNVNMSELEELILFSNKLSGAIPNFNAPKLTSLYLNNNQLSGCITASLKQYCGKSVDISGNPNLSTQNFAAFCSNGLGMCPAPDLTVSNLSTTTTLVPHNQVLNFTVDAKNRSTENATGTFTIKSYLSKDTILSSDDYQDGVIPTGNYGAGVEIPQIHGGMLVKNTLEMGYYYLIVKIDGDNEIVELEEKNNTTVFKTPILVSSIPPPENCFNKFQMKGVWTPACSIRPDSITANASYYTGSIQMYGARLTDGFMAIILDGSATQTRVSTLFATSPPTRVKPVDANFPECPSEDWLYFTANGVATQQYLSFIDSNIYIRVRYWGAETNPEFIYLQMYPATVSRLSFLSIAKSQNCAPCFKNDRTPPVINCPDTTVLFRDIPWNGYLSIVNLMQGITPPLPITDNCGENSLKLSMNYILNPRFGWTYPVHLIAYDSAGNASTCDFKVKIACPNFTPTFASCPQNAVITAAANQTCQKYNWIEPATNSYYEPVTVTSNFKPNDCFPIGLTKVLYSAVDSCKNILTCSFTIQVNPAQTTEQDIALSMTATPSVYRRYSTHNFKITAKNNGTSTFTNVKIKFTRPENTVNGGTKIASIGTFQDYCVGGIECSEWIIPTLPSGTTATLDAPIYILTPTGTITASANLLSSTPTDNVSANNTASLLISPSTLPTLAPANTTLTAHKPTSALPIVIQKLNPTVTEREINVEIESLMDKTIELSISNAMGQTVLVQKTAIHKGMNTLRFDVAHLPQGLYFIQTNMGKGRAVPTKFIKF